MTYQEALEHRENVTGHTMTIDNYEHVFLVVPAKKEDFLKYTIDYFSKYNEKTFVDETAQEYSTDQNFTVTNFRIIRD